jgi:hypothetical protein
MVGSWWELKTSIRREAASKYVESEEEVESSVSSASASFVRYVVARRYTNDMSLSCFSSVAIEFSPRIPFPNITQISKPKLIMPSRSRKKHERGHLGGFLTLFHSCFFFFCVLRHRRTSFAAKQSKKKKASKPRSKSASTPLPPTRAQKNRKTKRKCRRTFARGKSEKRRVFFARGVFRGEREKRECESDVEKRRRGPRRTTTAIFLFHSFYFFVLLL